ncbi:44212_t:CDS:2, partial [Gigaspora margarita]
MDRVLCNPESIYNFNHRDKNSSKFCKNKRETSLGTALMLAPQLQQYIHNIDKIPGMGVLVDLFLPCNTKVRIISTYIPSNDKELSQNIQEKVLEWVQQARRKNMLVIMMGDFNDNITRKKSKNQTPLLGNLLKNNVLSSLNFFAITDMTWRRNQSASQIDDIWISAEVIHEFIKPELWETNGAAKKHIKEVRICSKEYYAFTMKVTILYNALKKVNGIYKFCKKLPIPLLYEECTMQINKELEKRDKFTDNTKGMIKSVLKRKVAPIDTNQPATPIWQDWIA